TCIGDGYNTPTGSCEAASANVKAEAAEAYAAKKAAMEAANAPAPLTVEPGSALNGGKGAYVHDGANGVVTRDGFGRSCVKDSGWNVARATEECAPDLYARWREQNAPAVAGDQNLAKRTTSAPPEVPVPTAAADSAPGVAPPAEKKVEAAPVVDNALPDFPIVPIAPVAGDALADDDRAMPEDDPADDQMPDVYAEEEETTPDMMLSDADRQLPADDAPVVIEQPAPELADRLAMPAPEVPIARDDLDRTPGVAPPAEQKTETKSVVDNSTPDFPVTKIDKPADAKPAPPPAEPIKSLPVTIAVQGDGLFDFDQTALKSELVVKLDQVADLLTAADTKYDAISIVGHTDPVGSATYNQALSERRAEAAKKYLVGKGVDAGRIETSGKGESELVVKRADCAGKKGKKAYIACLEPNRRIVIDGKATRAK
nr:OmpA family protein [Burkholderiales bacterium]